MDDEDDDLEDDVDEPETAELVGRGAFRVDPAVMARKLSAYQLPDAYGFFIPWFRAAASLGARSVDARELENGLQFSFDGSPPASAVLAELTAGLLEADFGEAGRHLAYGALAIRRLQLEAPSAVRAGDRTVLTVVGGGGAAQRAFSALRSAYGMSMVELTVAGERVADPSKAVRPVKAWSNNTADAVILEDPGAPRPGRVRFFKLGMLVEEKAIDLGGYYTAYVSSTRFALSLSQSAVVHDKRYAKLVKRLGRLRRRLLLRDLPREVMVRVWTKRSIIALGLAGAGAFGLWRILTTGLWP